MELEPNLSPNLIGATYSEIDGTINPFKLIQRYRKQSEENGAEFSFYNKVIGLEKTSFGYRVMTQKGTFETEKLVIAAGLWSKDIGRFLDVEIPTYTSRGQILVTEPTERLINRVIVGCDS